MKRLFTFFAAMSLLCTTSSAKTLVVYYSYTGNCESIVTELTNQISADVLEIEPAEKGLHYEFDLTLRACRAIRAVGKRDSCPRESTAFLLLRRAVVLSPDNRSGNAYRPLPLFLAQTSICRAVAREWKRNLFCFLFRLDNSSAQ